MELFHSSRVHPLGWEGASDLTYVGLQQFFLGNVKLKSTDTLRWVVQEEFLRYKLLWKISSGFLDPESSPCLCTMVCFIHMCIIGLDIQNVLSRAQSLIPFSPSYQFSRFSRNK